MRPILFYCLALVAFACHAQRNPIPDSLSGKSYMYFREMLDNDTMDLAKQLMYAKVYLALSKARKNGPETIEAYKSLLYLSKGEACLQYADSMVYAARRTNKDVLIGSAYLTKGITYYKQKKHKEALENYLLADTYISKTNDRYLIHKLKYSLAETKYLLRHYESAVSLFRECVSYYEKTGGKPWLNSLHHLGLCYIQLQKHDLCTAVNELGLRESIKTGQDAMVIYFTHSEGVNQYYRKNYELALARLQQALPGLIKLEDMPNEMVACFYIAKSFADSKQFDKALPYLLKLDQALTHHNYIRKDLREGFSMLVGHYARSKNKELELRYSYQLRKADSLLSSDFETISNKLSARKDATNEARIDRLEKEKVLDNHFWVRVVSAVSITGIFGWGLLYYRNRQLRRNFQKNYDNFLLHGDSKAAKLKPPAYSRVDLSEGKEAELYNKLQQFEQRKDYLAANLSQFKVAKLLNTNIRYLIYIIKKYRQKGFVNYINDLKCEHARQLLEESSKYRNFDQQSLAKKVGFGTAQNLRSAFIKRYGYSTPFFIEQLGKKNNVQNENNDGKV